MSVFDTVTIDRVIRCNCGYRPKSFQTKSLDNCLDSFKIVRGILFKNECEYRLAERKEQVQCGKIWLPLLVPEKANWIKSKYSGTVDMYDFCDKCKKLIHLYLIVIDGKIKSGEKSISI